VARRRDRHERGGGGRLISGLIGYVQVNAKPYGRPIRLFGH